MRSLKEELALPFESLAPKRVLEVSPGRSRAVTAKGKLACWEHVCTIASPSVCARLSLFNIVNDRLPLVFCMHFSFLRMTLIEKVALLVP